MLHRIKIAVVGSHFEPSLAERIRCHVLYLICCKRGHAWEDTSICTPDTGTMELTCTRCGFTDGTILY